MNNDDNLDLLDLNDDTDTLDDSLPDAAPFTNPRPRRPWLLLAVGVLIIILATYIIIRTIGDDSSSSMQVDLDAPAIVVEDGGAAIPAPVNSAPAPVNVAPAPQPAPAPQTGPQPVAQPASAPQPAQPAAGPAPQNTTSGVPVRVIEDRRDVRFNPEQAQPAAKPAPAPQPQQPARRQQAQSAQTTPRASDGMFNLDHIVHVPWQRQASASCKMDIAVCFLDVSLLYWPRSCQTAVRHIVYV